MREIKEIVKSREIDCLFHFTQLQNLESILEHGLLSRNSMERVGAVGEINDPYRFNGQLGAISCSIWSPNYKLFYRLRKNDETKNWIVLVLKKKVLWNKPCAFCKTNAANNDESSIPLQDRQSPGALLRMFEEVEGKPSREALKLSESCPTDPQAEVLVLDDVEPRFIVGAFTSSKAIEIELKQKYPEFQFHYNRAFFLARNDYEHWR